MKIVKSSLMYDDKAYRIIDDFGIIADGADFCQSSNRPYVKFGRSFFATNKFHGPIRGEGSPFDIILPRGSGRLVHNEELLSETKLTPLCSTNIRVHTFETHI
jgi:hypothetical protein